MNKYFGLIFLMIFLCVFAVNLTAQNFLETHQKIRRAIENRDYSSAVKELQDLQKSNKKVFELNNFDYLLARMAEKRGDFALAAANFQNVANRNSLLKEYALWHLAQIARSSGNLMLERVHLQEIQTATNSNSLLNSSVNARLARSWFESRNFDSSINLLSTQNPAGKTSDSKDQKPASDRLFRENLVLLGESFLLTNKLDEARAVFKRLTDELPNPSQPDDFALAGAKGLDILDGKSANNLALSLPEQEHLKRAHIYQFNRDFPNARLHYEAIVKNYPASEILPEAIFQIGRGYSMEDNFTRAIEFFERLHNEFPDSPLAPDALSQAGSAFSRVNKIKEAVARYQKIIEKYPDYARLERAYLNIVDILRDSGADTDALKWTAKTQEAFRSKLPEALALFAQARIHFSKNDWESALSDLEKLLTFSDLGETRAPGATNKAEITFLRGIVLEKLNRFPESIDAYLSIPDGRGEYYGWRATERLRTLAKSDDTRKFTDEKISQLKQSQPNLSAESLKDKLQSIYRINESAENLEAIKKIYSELPAYRNLPSLKFLEFGRKEILAEEPKNISANTHKNLADELLFLGLYDEGAPELEAAFAESTDDTQKNNDRAYTLAVLYQRGDMAHRAVGFIEPLWRNMPKDFLVEQIPRHQAEMLYPAPYADSLLKFAPKRNVDPRFALSIMRQESRYRADVKSVAAARGLMQFISSTSDKIAAELGRKDFRQDELYNPPTAVLFGSQYLSNLFKQFPSQPQAVAASYNGGENNMMRWLARSKSDEADRYVSEIIFSQSKDYVYKVMANYRVYQMLYDENLKNKLAN